LLACCAAARAADALDLSNRVVHPASSAAANRLASFHVAPGFKIELVATEPMVSAPVAIAFDEKGRLFVAEMRDYPNLGNAKPHLGRVRVLTDPDAAGVFQTSTVYAEDLRWPSGLACYAGGVFVIATPDLFYFRDSGGDGTADVKRLVLTGFGETNAPDAQLLPNSLTWGLDNRFYGATAGIGGTLTASNWPSGPVSLTGSDFAFAPRSLDVFRETGPAQSGLTFDDEGCRFVSDRARPLLLPMYEVRYTERNPFYAKPPAFIDVANPASQIFPFGTKPEASNTSARSIAELPSASNTNVVTPTWLVNARGSLIYRGRAFPTNYYGNAFIPDPDAHVVHRLIVRENGLEAVAQRPREELRREFLIATDPSFRPVQAVGGPDGALYIVDMQNGEDRGRIYRVAPANFKPSKPPQLGKARTYDLVAALAGADGWYCDTAGRLLYERNDPAAVPLLTNMLGNSRLPLARLRALHALGGMRALSEADAISALHDTDARVREHGVLLSEQLITIGVFSGTLWTELKALAADPALRVRCQLAFTVGETARPDKAVVLAEILRRDPGDPWIGNAVLSSLAEGAGDLFLVLAGDVRFRNDPAGYEFLRRLAAMIGTMGRIDEVRKVVAFLAQTQLDRLQMFGFAAALGKGLINTRSSLAFVDPQATLLPLSSGAFQSAIDSFTPPAVRIEALRFVSVGPTTFTDTGDWLLTLCNPQPSAELRAAAIAAVARYGDPRVVSGLLDRWPVFGPALRTQALTAMLARRSLVPLLMDAVTNRGIASTDFSATQLDFLRTYDDLVVSERAVRLFGPFTTRRPAVMDQFNAALRLRGDAAHGRAVFTDRCADCHRLEGAGQAFGPDLVGAKVKGKEKLFAAIIEPSAALEPGYETCILETAEGENLVGIKADDNPSTVTLRQPQGESVVIPRFNVEGLRTPDWSLMPAGLEQGLASQDLADLLEYLMTVPGRTNSATP
jgi:putative membrane-bound dehydrogenase-like protein